MKEILCTPLSEPLPVYINLNCSRGHGPGICVCENDCNLVAEKWKLIFAVFSIYTHVYRPTTLCSFDDDSPEDVAASILATVL